VSQDVEDIWVSETSACWRRTLPCQKLVLQKVLCRPLSAN